MVEIAALPSVTATTLYQYVDDWIEPYEAEANFGIVRFGGDDPKLSYYVVQRLNSLLSDGVRPWEGELKVQIPLDYETLQAKRPALAGSPKLEPPYPRWYALRGQQGELVVAFWLPVVASDERKSFVCDVKITTTGFGFPIEIDTVTGERHDLKMSVDQQEGQTILKDVRVPDYPVIIRMFPLADINLP